ncbi:MAG: hypothetical protein K0S70_69 [Microbacterium sp.]|jgi:hypothetical protein|nr:hypothetical protein [Microbacterium sp.]
MSTTIHTHQTSYNGGASRNVGVTNGSERVSLAVSDPGSLRSEIEALGLSPEEATGLGVALINAAQNVRDDRWGGPTDDLATAARVLATLAQVGKPEDAPQALTLAVTRPVDRQEVEDLITGTGVLSYSWWLNVEDAPDAMGGTGDAFLFTHWEPDTEGGSVQTTVTAQQIVDAAARVIKGDGAKVDAASARDMANDTLGYADSIAADAVLQLAVFGRVIYG